MYQVFGKRFFDILLSLSSLIILSPILLLTALVIFLQDRHNVIFKHKRVGLNGELFTFLKFRSMPVNTSNLPSSEVKQLKVTPFGKIIRRTNIDELPQLVNILKGDMSIVGPRPPIPVQTDLIELRKQNGAISCRPGLTGLAQVNSYDFMPVEKKAEWDGLYASNISFLNDVLIILKTFSYLFKKPPTY